MLQTAVGEENQADPSRTLQQAYTPKGCERMTELPQGDVTEVRRGDPNALRVLSSDMARLSTTGYIRTERKPKDAMPRVGQVLFVEGHPVLAVHESEALLFGLEALLEIENDAMPMETLLAVHELSAGEAQRVSTLYSNAFLHLETASTEPSADERWWSNVTLRKGSWRREERLPELEVTVDAPEAIKQRSQAYMGRHQGSEKMIHPGDALMLDALDPSEVFTLAGHLANHGRPVLVLSRHDVDSLSVEHGLPVSACHWLSTGNHPRAIQPTLQDVRAKIDAFLWENMRAVVVLEGVEYLAGMNGDGPTIDFLRDAVDGVRMDDHVLLTTVDLNAFEIEPRHRLERCFSMIEQNDVEQWLIDPELLLDHPLCAPPTDEERQWIEHQLKRAIEHSPVQTSGTGEMTMIGGEEPVTSEERQQATAALEGHIQAWAEEQEPTLPASTEPRVVAEVVQPVEVQIEQQNPTPQPTPVESKVEEAQARAPQVMPEPTLTTKQPPKPSGPRTPQRIRRRKKKHSPATRHSQFQTQAAVAHAPESSPEFKPPVSHRSSVALTHQLETYEARQEAALDKTFQPRKFNAQSLRDAAMQTASTRQHNLPSIKSQRSPIEAVKNIQPTNASTTLTPLSARPGVEAEAQPKQLPREIASSEQAPPSIEDSLSSWEIEDLERLRKEREGEA